MRVTFQVEHELPRGARARLRRMLARLSGELGLRGRSLGVAFTDDATIRAHNARYRRKDRATDVLSFEGEGRYLGDLVISVERARQQASAWGHEFETELEVLLLHGVLHLLGHDHETDGGQMRRLEARLARRVLGARGLTQRATDRT